MDDIGSTMSHFLTRNSRLIGAGQLPGELYDLGNYPGAIYKPDTSTLVHGKVFELNHPEKVLQQLDYYEGIGIGKPEAAEYQRVQCTVFCKNKEILCWVYLYQQATDSLSLIESGNYSLHHQASPFVRISRDS